YDTHIPFLLFGWNVRHGSSNVEAHIVDIAPTICAMLHIQMPNGCVGTARY
ncbi:MAG: alkaline phosphatase family protein, partial [Prevotella sp.]|nr:alkaline phosphatase family protein [Prevotella sp.]